MSKWCWHSAGSIPTALDEDLRFFVLQFKHEDGEFERKSMNTGVEHTKSSIFILKNVKNIQTSIEISKIIVRKVLWHSEANLFRFTLPNRQNGLSDLRIQRREVDKIHLKTTIIEEI